MSNPPPPLPTPSTPPAPAVRVLPSDPLPGHCGLRKRHLTHRFVAGDPLAVYRCRGAAVPPVGTPVRQEDPHWLARVGVGAPW